MVNTACIPEALVALPRWVVWRQERRGGKLTKVPYAPTCCWHRARVNDPATWGTFDQAVDCYRHLANGADGIGFVLAGDGLVGIDLDRCVDEHGVLAPWAQEIVQLVRSYSELSPSRNGLHIFLRGALPDGRRRKGQIEMYDRARYFTVTGDRWPSPPAVEERQEELALLYRSLFPPVAPLPAPPAQPAPVLADDELIRRAMRARNGDKFAALWHGDWSRWGYRSQSEADLALCSILAFWTRGDAARVDRLFRRSGLFRCEKWDARHFSDGRTYGQATIQRALLTDRRSQ